MLKIKREYGLNCIDLLIKTIAEYEKRSYELMFIGAIGFSFIRKSEHIASLSSNESNRFDMLKKYHSIAISFNRFENFSDYMLFIKKELAANKLVIVYVDDYWVPWSTADFQIHHDPHALLITQEVDEGLFCYDYANLDGKVMPLNYLEKCFGTILSYNVKLQQYSEFDLLSILCDLRNELHRKFDIVTIDQFEDLISYLTNDNFVISKLFNGDEFSGLSSIMPALNRISQCRYQFALLLEYLNMQSGIAEFELCGKQYRDCAALWKMVWSLLVKSNIANNNQLILKAVKVLNELKTSEQKLIENLLNLIDKIEHKTLQLSNLDSHNDYNNRDFTDFSYVNLTEYYNHKAFGSINEPLEAHFENGYILIDKDIQRGYVQKNEFKFRLADIEIKAYDNIFCDGQVIRINQECSCIMIMSASEHGPQKDRALIKTPADNFQLEIMSTQWVYENSAFGDTIVWNGFEVVEGYNGRILHPDERYIYAKSYLLENKQYIESITLPSCPNMHIFAITLCK